MSCVVSLYYFVGVRNVLVVCKQFSMLVMIDNPARYEVRTVIHLFLLANNNSAAEIHRQLCEVYGAHVRSQARQDAITCTRKKLYCMF